VGSILSECRITPSLVGIRAVVREGAVLEGSIVMGAKHYEEEGASPVPTGIGRDCRLRRAIVDLDARIGAGSRLLNERGVQEADGPGWHIRGGVIVVPQGAILPPGTEV
jgi:glucose-1-phosphate adenylyltransferase